MKNNNLIGISGKIGSGKDTIGLIIQFVISEYYYHKQILHPFDPDKIVYIPNQFQVKKFAGKLKQIVSLLTGYKVEELEYQSIKDTILSDDWNRPKSLGIGTRGFKIESMTVRDLLQKVGTEAMRDVIHENIWVNALFSDYKDVKKHSSDGAFVEGYDYYESPNWVVTDCRFPNEAKAILDRGGILIKTIRDQNQDVRNAQHPSETALDQYDRWDYIINNNGTIEELVKAIENILRKEKII